MRTGLWLILVLAAFTTAPRADSRDATATRVCDIILSPEKYQGRDVTFFAFRRNALELLLVNGPDCNRGQIVVADSVKGRMETGIRFAGRQVLLPSGVFSGKIRVLSPQKGEPSSVILHNGIIRRPGWSVFSVTR